jgi:hypothetical protein
MPSPTEGGCWFCHRNDGELVFEDEFDTFVHINCIRVALKDSDKSGKPYQEAELMAYLLAGDN